MIENNEVATAQRVADYDQRVAVLQRKLDRTLEERSPKVRATLNHINEEGRMLEDFIVPVGGEKLSLPLRYDLTGQQVEMVLNGRTYRIHEHALRQIAYRADIPYKFLRKHAYGDGWQRHMIEIVLNNHNFYLPGRNVLIRTVGDEVRSYLSDKYKRMNSIEIYDKFITVCGMRNATLIDAFHDGIRGYIEAVIPVIMPLTTELNGIVPVIMGAQVSNSEHGDGALDAKGYLMDVRCLNGYVGKSFFRKTHIGSRLSEDIRYSEQTYRLDTQAMTSAIGDVIDQIFSPDVIKENLNRIERNASMEIDMQSELKKLPNLSMHSGITIGEVEAIEKKLLNNDPADGVEGAPTTWKLTQAMTAVANDVGGRRAREIQEIAYSLLK